MDIVFPLPPQDIASVVTARDPTRHDLAQRDLPKFRPSTHKSRTIATAYYPRSPTALFVILTAAGMTPG